MRGRHKAWAVPYLEEHPDICLKTIDETDPFFACEKLYLEIGIGKGDFIVGMSKKLEGNFLGLERERSIIGMAAKKIEAESLPNVKVMAEDFDFVYEQLSKLRFDAIFLNFSDPWPKKRHAKRRLTTSGRLKAMGALLKEGGRILIKTDNDILYAFTMEEIPSCGLELVYATDHYEFDETSDVMSEYERNFRGQGKNIHRIELRKGA